VAGHFIVVPARTRGPFWRIRLARILLLAVLDTQALVTIIAVLGIFLTPLVWRYAAVVWDDALAWFAVTNRVKLLGYRAIDPDGATGVAPRRGRSSDDVATVRASNYSVSSRSD
jgi:H+-transporting ATPase